MYFYALFQMSISFRVSVSLIPCTLTVTSMPIKSGLLRWFRRLRNTNTVVWTRNIFPMPSIYSPSTILRCILVEWWLRYLPFLVFGTAQPLLSLRVARVRGCYLLSTHYVDSSRVISILWERSVYSGNTSLGPESNLAKPAMTQGKLGYLTQEQVNQVITHVNM